MSAEAQTKPILFPIFRDVLLNLPASLSTIFVYLSHSLFHVQPFDQHFHYIYIFNCNNPYSYKIMNALWIVFLCKYRCYHDVVTHINYSGIIHGLHWKIVEINDKVILAEKIYLLIVYILLSWPRCLYLVVLFRDISFNVCFEGWDITPDARILFVLYERQQDFLNRRINIYFNVGGFFLFV